MLRGKCLKGLRPPERWSSSCGGGNARRALSMVDVQVATERGGRDAGVGSGTGGQELGGVGRARRCAHTLPTRARRERGLGSVREGVGSVEDGVVNVEEVAVAGRLGCSVSLRAGPTGLERLPELGDNVDGAVKLVHDLVEWHRATFGLEVDEWPNGERVVRRAAVRVWGGKKMHSSRVTCGCRCGWLGRQSFLCGTCAPAVGQRAVVGLVVDGCLVGGRRFDPYTALAFGLLAIGPLVGGDGEVGRPRDDDDLQQAVEDRGRHVGDDDLVRVRVWVGVGVGRLRLGLGLG